VTMPETETPGGAARRAEVLRQRQEAALRQAPRDPGLFDCQGTPYVDFLAFVTRTLQSERYLEVGTSSGRSLAAIDCRALAIDPQFKINANVIGTKSVCLFYQMTSDRFFRHHDPAQLLGGPFDVAFLDGFHIFEFLLRDFIHTERHGRRNSVIFLHDCLPFNLTMTRREPLLPGAKSVGIWTGDVWKLVPILRQYRPDLKVHLLDCFPTGLVMITGLDPSSRVLTDSYFDIVAQYGEGPGDAEALRDFRRSVNPIASAAITGAVDLAPYCW